MRTWLYSLLLWSACTGKGEVGGGDAGEEGGGEEGGDAGEEGGGEEGGDAGEEGGGEEGGGEEGGGEEGGGEEGGSGEEGGGEEGGGEEGGGEEGGGEEGGSGEEGGGDTDPPPEDGDGDGWDAESDCDDADAAVNPGATETCNDRDDDCDRVADEADASDAGTWYTDADADGYGDPAVSTVACEAPELTTSDASDCDDTDAAVNPGATETCNDRDDDCDRVADEADASDAGTWYTDADGDGYGDPAVSTVACEAPELTTSDASDCDDTDAAVNPGATETCNDRDDDCDGSVDIGVEDGETWYLDADGDGYGDPEEAVSGCGSDPRYVALGTDCDDDDAETWPEAEEKCWDELDQDCDGDIVLDDDCAPEGTISMADEDAMIVGSEAGDRVGTAVSLDGDVDGDGWDDLFVGAPGAGSSDVGRAYLYYGPITEGLWDFADDLRLEGGAASDGLGSALAHLQDLDGDGFHELLVAASAEDGGGAGAGRAYVFLGAASAATDEMLASEADIELGGEAAGEAAGTSVDGRGDLDGDGIGDLVVGAPGHDRLDEDEGAAAVLLGAGAAGAVALSDADTLLLGEHPGDAAGTSVAFAGDVDGDGTDDLLVGAPANDEGASGAGKAYLLHGPLPAGALDLVHADAMVLGDSSSDALGRGVAALGDLDADGYADLGISATGDARGGTGSGSVFVLKGPVPGVRHASSFADHVLVGELSNDAAGTGLAGGRDVDGDGYDDVAVGAPGHDGGASNAGSAYLFYGPLESAATIDLSAFDAEFQGATASGAGGSALALGDLDADGYADLAVGSPTASYSTSITTSGTVRVFLGGGRVETPVIPAELDHGADDDGDGWTEDEGDCDDSRAEVSPSTEEACENELDDDCDGHDPRCAPDTLYGVGDAHALFYAETRYDDAGAAVAGLGDVNGDGWNDLAVGVPLREYGATGGQVSVFFGPVSWGENSAYPPDLQLHGEAEDDEAGSVLTGPADLDGDGIQDLIVQADGAATVYVVHGHADLGGALSLGDADLVLGGGSSADVSLSAGGDLDGDGLDDLVIGIPNSRSGYYELGIVSSGAVYAWYGGRESGTWDLADDADAAWYGEGDGDHAGTSVSIAPDIDADGTDDLLIGAPGSYDPDYYTGKAYLVHGPTDAGDHRLAEVDTSFVNAECVGSSGGLCGAAGRGVAGLGDVDADGYGDLLIASYSFRSSVTTRPNLALFRGPVPRVRQSLTSADHIWGGATTGPWVLDGGGDVDGDGRADFVYGYPTYYSSWGGLWLHYGREFEEDEEEGSYTVGDASWRGESGVVYLASAAVIAPDLDGDGYDDLLIGIEEYDGPTLEVGAAIVHLGGPRAGVETVRAPAVDRGADDDGDGASEEDGDCLDVDHAVYPSAEEVCGDELDNDCSDGDRRCLATGLLDEDHYPRWDGVARSDFASAASMGDVDGDGTDELAFGCTGCDYSVTNAGAVSMFYGPPHGGDRDPAEADVLLVGEAGSDAAGSAIAAGDLDGDGFMDPIAGVIGAGEGGQVYVLWGGALDGEIGLGEADAILDPAAADDYLGEAVAALDLDGDGVDDLVSAATYVDGVGTNSGAVYALFGPLAEGTPSASDADLTWTGDSALLYFAQALWNAGDVDGDGTEDLLVGTTRYSAAASSAGRVSLFLGGSSLSSGSVDEAWASWDGEAASDRLGRAMAAGDADGDGSRDLLLGTPYGDAAGTDAGQAYLWLGPLEAGAWSAGDADLRLLGETAGDDAAQSVAMSDLDADGLQDLAVGAEDNATYGSSRGAAYVFLGPATATGDLDLDRAEIIVSGDSDYDVGQPLAGGADADGDGYEDLFIGMYSDGKGMLLYGGER